MTSWAWQAVLVGASFSLHGGIVAASPQVVGDDACERYAVDIASFATCEGDKVVRPAAHEVNVAPASLDARIRVATLLADASPSSTFARALAGSLVTGALPAPRPATARDCAQDATIAAQAP